MGQLVASVVGAAAGFALGGPLGAQLGFAIGSTLYASSQTVRNRGPLSNDLKAPKLQYGATIPRIYGRMRLAGIPVWLSDKRAIENTTSEGGKGGPTVENTVYTYEVDGLFMVAIESDVIAVTRVWVNGKVVFCALADASDETISASASTEAWAAMTLFDGNPAQEPWSVYEAAVGTEDALAYRRRTTIGIQALNLGGSDQIPLIEFEVITAGSPEGVEADTLLLAPLTESGEDISAYARTSTYPDETPVFDPDDGMATGNSDYVDFNDFILCPPEGLTLEWWSMYGTLVGSGGGESQRMVSFPLGGVSGSNFQFSWLTSSGGWRLLFGTVSPDPLGPLASGVWHHFAATISDDSSDPTVRLFSNGVLVAEGVAGLGTTDAWPTFSVEIGDYFHNGEISYRVQDVRIRKGVRYTTTFTPPARGSLAPDAGLVIWEPAEVDLADIVSAECALSGLEAGQIDVTDIAGIDVTGFPAVGSARQTIEQLMAGYYFEACCSDKLYFRRRGRAVAATIAYDDLAAGVEDASDTTFDPVRGNPEELPAQVACGFMNISADYEAGSEMGDRLVGPGKLVQKVELPLVMTPAQGKGRALAMVMDALHAGTSGTISVTDDYAALEPTDAIVVPDKSGTLRRVRIVRESYQQGVKTLEIVGDDPSALVTTGLTMDESTPAISVRPPVDTELVLLDVPLLIDGYDTPGFMAAAAPATDNPWSGAAIKRSVDDVSYATAATATQAAVFGVAGELGDWAGGKVFDEQNTVSVSVNGELASSTRAALFADRTVNVAAIGAHGRWEIVRFRSASLLAPGQYLLSGLLRGQLGTEWAMGTHETGDVFVLLNTALRRIEHTVADIELERFYRAVTFGRTDGTADVVSFTDTGVGLKPLSPVDARGSRDGSDNLTLTWRRRTRVQTRYFGALPASVPLGEATELYSIDVLDGSDVVRTLTSTTPEVEYTAAEQTADGLTPGDPVSVRIHQVSAAVGRGYEHEATV